MNNKIYFLYMYIQTGTKMDESYLHFNNGVSLTYKISGNSE